jgi:hypothetical protein
MVVRLLLWPGRASAFLGLIGVYFCGPAARQAGVIYDHAADAPISACSLPLGPFCRRLCMLGRSRPNWVSRLLATHYDILGSVTATCVPTGAIVPLIQLDARLFLQTAGMAGQVAGVSGAGPPLGKADSHLHSFAGNCTRGTRDNSQLSRGVVRLFRYFSQIARGNGPHQSARNV